jgi:predicted homoserine dehydrogenase-like protein
MYHAGDRAIAFGVPMTIAKERTLEQIRIALVGAGETGTPLLRTLLDAKFVQVVGVADLDSEMPGMKLARERGVHTTNDFMDFVRLGDGVDILIDVTGAASVRDRLRQEMQATGNHHTIIMHEMIAVLLMSLSQGKLVSMKHNQVNYS